MKTIPHKPEKLRFFKQIQKFNCSIAQHEKLILPIEELHHRLHDTNVNVKLYPLFIHSVFNLTGVNHRKHMERPYFAKIPLITADKIERYLKLHPNIASWANYPVEITQGIIYEYNRKMKEWEINLEA